MSGNVYFIDVNRPPPGNLFFYETHGERVVARTFLEIKPKVMALMAKYGIKGMAEIELARYMCPRLPDSGAFCRGENIPMAHVRPQVALRESLPYCKRPVVDFDVASRRMRVCAACPRHKRDWCPTCSGHVSAMKQAFGNRRMDLPEDTLSGVCQCARAYEIAIASVEYGKDEPVWPDVPETCWRNKDV